LIGVSSLFDGELGTLDDVTEPLDTQSDRTALFIIEVQLWELVDIRGLQFSII